jgi:hypothetical protein
MALGSTQPLTEMSIRNVSGGVKVGRCVRPTTSPPSVIDCLEDVGASTSHNPVGLHGLLQGKLFYGLFNDVVGSSEHIPLNGRVMSE